MVTRVYLGHGGVTTRFRDMTADQVRQLVREAKRNDDNLLKDPEHKARYINVDQIVAIVED